MGDGDKRRRWSLWRNVAVLPVVRRDDPDLRHGGAPPTSSRRRRTAREPWP